MELVRPPDLAADLAGDGAGSDRATHPAAQGVQPGVPDDRGRADQRHDGAGAVHLHRRVPGQQRRLWRHGRSGAVRAGAGGVGGAVPGAAAEEREVNPGLVRRLDVVGAAVSLLTLVLTIVWAFPLLWSIAA